MRDRLVRALRWPAAVTATVVALVVGIVLAEAVPDAPVVRRLDTAAEAGAWGTELAPDGFGGFHDGFTECVALGVGLGSPPEPMGLVERALWAPRLGACDRGPAQVAALRSGEVVEAGPYFRYWNGATFVVRPVVAAFGVGGLRVVTGVLLLGATLAAALVVGRRVGWMATLALAVPLLVGTNAAVTPWGSLTHALSLAAAFVGTAVVAQATAASGGRGAAAGAAGAAALFVYVDLLTTPALAWGLAAFVAGATALAHRGEVRDLAAAGVAAGVAWPTAWALTWAARWAAAAAVHGREVWSTIGDVSRFRLSGELEGVSEVVGAATRTNVDWWLSRTTSAPWVLAAALVVALLAVGVAVHRAGVTPTASRVGLLAAPALVVPLWYEVLSNHSQVHAFFTYRSVAAAVGIGVAACVVAARQPAA